MKIRVVTHKEVELSTSEVKDVVDQWLEEQIGNHFVRDGQLFRQDDYGHHRGGDLEVLIVPVTAPPDLLQRRSDHEEMISYRYNFIRCCLDFRVARGVFAQAKASDK